MQRLMSLDDEIAALFEGKHLEDPFPIWNRLRKEAPVFSGDRMVILSRYADVKAMLTDDKRYSARKGRYSIRSRPEEIAAALPDETRRMWQEMIAHNSASLSEKDGADHDRLRGIAHRFFTPGRMRSMEGVIQGFWDDLLEEAAREDVYDHKRFSQTLALRVITDIVGCPQVDAPYVAGLVERLAQSQLAGTGNEAIVRSAYETRSEFNNYIERAIVAEYRRRPDSSAFVRAVMDAEGEDNLSALELSAMVSVLLFGGIETTAVLLSSGLLELLYHRDQWEWLCDDPEARVPAAVEELFRYVSPAQFIPHTAVMGFEIEGVRVRAGDTVTGAVAPAHRDPAEYENPETLDITRGRAHLGLGAGRHFCLGAAVVRAEARIVLTTLAQRYPNLELAIDRADVDWSGGPPSIRSVRVLPIRLGQAG